MMRKRLLALFLVLGLLLSLSACMSDLSFKISTYGTEPETEPATEPAQDPTQQQPSAISPLLYKVTDADGHVLWLFGSIHVGYDYFYPLPEYVYSAYDSADAIAFEFDIKAFETDMSAQVDALTQMTYTDGTTISDHIDEDVYEEAVAILTEYGYYNQYLDYYIPIMWSSLLDSFLYEELGLDSELGIDNHLINKAYDEGKEVLEVESAEFQYGMMANFSPELQEILLMSSILSVYYPDDAKASTEALVSAWASGDAAALEALLNEEGTFTSEEERLLYEEYNNAMIVQRNLSMTDYAENVLKSGKEVFICVGAAHIVGAGAMADLLQQRGYTVEQVGAIRTV